jgi:predicted TIM-barrel fold metal-dependent hydrolase
VERVLTVYPALKLVVPHLGADEFDAYRRLQDRFDTLWLDTTMVLAGYLPLATLPRIEGMRPDRLMYGSDFPNIPYAWDRELRRLAVMELEKGFLRGLLADNAAALFGIQLDHGAGKDGQQ